MADGAGFESYVVAAGPRLHRIAYLLCGDAALAEDLVQAALVKAWLAWPRVVGDPDPYVRRVLVTTWSSWWRRRWRGERPTEVLPEPPPTTGSDVDARLALWPALRRLPDRQRAVVVLRYVEDLPESEVARLLGVSVGTVKSQASKALAKLRVDEALAPDDVEIPRGGAR